MEAELRWILIGLSAVLLLGIWWWGARRSSQASGDAQLREPKPQEREPYVETRAEARSAPFVAGAERDWGVSPLEPLSIRKAPEPLPVMDPPMSALAPQYVEPFIGEEVEIALEEAPQTPQTPRISAVSDAVIEASEVLSAEPVRHAAIAKARDRFAPPPSAASDDVAAEAAYEASEQGAITQPVPAIVGTGRSAPAVPEPLAADGAERAVPVNTTPNTVQKQKIVTVRVSARAETRWSGEVLLRALESNGLAYGRYQVFHRRHVDGRSLFCLASLIEPGTFDIERMPQEEFRGVTLFAVLPGPVEPLLTVDELFSAAQGLAEELAGVIQDAKGVPFSPQRIAAVRDDVARFQAAIATSRE